MNIELHIDRLVLDGVAVPPGERSLLQGAVEGELAQLLAGGGLNDALRSGGAWWGVRGEGIQLAKGWNVTRLGEQIAGVAYGGIGK